MNRTWMIVSLALSVAAGALLFGADNKEEPATTKRPDGLVIKIVQEAADPGAKKGDVLWVHYTGTLQNGTKFDSSVDRGQPFKFVLGEGNVIKGWDEGLVGMKIGEKRQLTIPPALGYGDRESGKIPANSTLIFDVEMVGIARPPADKK